MCPVKDIKICFTLNVVPLLLLHELTVTLANIVNAAVKMPIDMFYSNSGTIANYWMTLLPNCFTILLDYDMFCYSVRSSTSTLYIEPVLTKQWLMCISQGHNAVTPVRLEPATFRSQNKHSTTEPMRSLLNWLQSLKQFFINVSYHILVASLTLMALF